MSRLACLVVVSVPASCHVRRPVPVPVAVRERSNEMRLRVAGGWALSGVGVACLPYRLAPLFDKGDGEGGGANEGWRGGYARRMVGEGGLLGIVSCGVFRMR